MKSSRLPCKRQPVLHIRHGAKATPNACIHDKKNVDFSEKSLDKRRRMLYNVTVVFYSVSCLRERSSALQIVPNGSRKIFFSCRPIGVFMILVLLCGLLLGCTASGEREDVNETNGNGITPPSSTPDRPRVALTFDDGPHNVRTKQIVDELNQYGYHATFFVVGNRVDGTEYSGGEAMQYAAENGNEIGIHGYTHQYDYSDCSDQTYRNEVLWTDEEICKKIPGYKVRLMRPIGGSITSDRAEQSEYSVILWSVDSEDWKYKRDADDAEHEQHVETIVDNVLSTVSDGDIILMHDIYQNTYEAVVILLQRLNELGYDVVTVSELLGDDMQCGTIYRRG